MATAQKPLFSDGNNMYFDGTGDYDQSEYWEMVAKHRDGLDLELIIAAVSAAADDERIKMKRGLIPEGSDVSAWVGREYHGDWYIASTAHAATISGLPVGFNAAGNFMVRSGFAPGYGFTTHIASKNGTDPALYWSTLRSSGVFNPWVRIDQPAGTEPLLYRGFIPEGADVTTWGAGERGTWYVPSVGHAETITGLPVNAPGSFTFDTGIPGYAYHGMTFKAGGTSPGYWWTSKRNASDYNPWVNLATAGGGGGSPGDEPVAVGMKNTDLLDMMVQRKGGSVGTGGLAAFALRVDHGTVAFQEHLGPLLKKYGLPATMAVYSKQREIAPDTNSTAWPTVESWHRRYGLTFGNHSDDHLDKPNASGWYGGTIGSAAALKTLMPSVPVENYIPHGSVGYERYGGFNAANSHDAIVGTLAGRMALSTHALIAGYRGSRYRPLRGQPMQGLTHWTMEKSTPATFKSVLNSAISDGMGLAVMFHPQFIGINDNVYMNWVQVEECLAYVAQKRDEGALVTLTLDGLACADSRSDYRDDLHRDPLLANSGVWGGTGFTKNAGAYASSTAGAEASYALSLANKGWSLGGARLAQWHLTVESAANITVTVTDDTGAWAADRTVDLAAGTRVVHNPFGIPLDHAGNLVTKLVLNSGSVTIKKSHLYAN